LTRTPNEGRFFGNVGVIETTCRAATRLDRQEGVKARFGSAAYAMEELRAELSSAFIAGELGIPANIPRHASYVAEWLRKLKDDKREIFRAAADAQRIVDMVLGFHPDFAAQPDRPNKNRALLPKEPFYN
jgi:antirestriction protein ArdC